MNRINLLDNKDLKHIHFIGIGGISMSGLAEILLHHKFKVSGSDMKMSGISERLKTLGAEISYGHSEKNITTPDLVVYTAAIAGDNPELLTAISKNIPTIDRAALLGEIMKKYPYNVAVSGTHGKTTTTSMISMILLESNLDPTIHIGGVLTAIDGNTKIGDSGYFVTEACEYVESFLKFHPYLAVILNIEQDHLDYFSDLDHIKSAFLKFASLVPQNGYLVVNLDNENTMSITENINCNILTYGISSQSPDWKAENIEYNELGHPSFDLFNDGKYVARINLSIPGIHNISNSLAAICSASALGCKIEDIKEGLKKFTGTHRRFEFKGNVDDIKVIDDYAHHPTEIQATLNAARNSDSKRIWCIFQPHTYTRTKALFGEFSNSFDLADKIIITDIYAAREKDPGDIHSSTLCEKISESSKDSVYIQDFDSIVDYLIANTQPGDLVITMGAGDINTVGEKFLEKKKLLAHSLTYV